MSNSQVALPLAPCLDDDIFGIGKRPVQRDIEMDGCVRLVFVEERVGVSCGRDGFTNGEPLGRERARAE